jgi:D-arabinose 1-dehydrogenase-like Zn-dependent alcohol dehydrogenase
LEFSYEHIPITETARGAELYPGTTGRRATMKNGEKLVIIGRGGTGGPAAMLSRKLMPGVDVTIVSEEERFIVR